ncbi:MAG: hypothetical protein RLY71_1713 [Pseudomonadota bacterium]
MNTDFVIFNHHSLPFQSAQLAQDAVPEFLQLCLRAGRLGLKTILLDEDQDPSWFRMPLAPNYCWQDWHDQISAKGGFREQISAFRSIATRQPLMTMEDLEHAVLFDVKEIKLQTSYSTLRAAAWHDSGLISFPTGLPWNVTPIRVEVSKLDQTNSIITDGKDVINLFSIASLATIEQDLVNARNLLIKSGKDLWEQRKQLFSNLHFCGQAPDQIKSWTHHPSCFEQVRESLHILNIFSERWLAGEISDYTHDTLRDLGLTHRVSGESESCFRDHKRRRQRTFYLNTTGESVYFENHIKLSLGFRIHFYCNLTDRTIHIGYIGPHLV